MTELSGRWTLTVIGNEAGWQQGVRIIGSAAHDGIHPLALGDTIVGIGSAKFIVDPVAFNPATRTWEASLQRERMGWDAATGVTMTIFADDNPAAPDGDFNDLIVRCFSDDRELTPPEHPPLDLTLPEFAVGRTPENPPWRRER